MSANPYDQLPYRCQPIEWTAPERLALTSFLHGGPAPSPSHYRVLELGCGDGSNLLPMAYYRPAGKFVGVDGAASQIAIAQSRQQQLNLRNVEFLALDFCDADAQLQGQFDFIIVHGVFSWVAQATRDALFRLCQRRLCEDGLLYLNYNTRPGWNVRGMVRDYLMDFVDHDLPLAQQVKLAQSAAAKMAQSLKMESLKEESHPYSQLLANEFQFVCDSHQSYVAHEYLAQHNVAYWRSEFLALAKQYDLYPVADADYNYPTGRIDEALPLQLQTQELMGSSLEDTVDLVSYRQLHTPILSKHKQPHHLPEMEQLAQLRVASCLQPVGPHRINWYQHPNGYQVEAKNNELAKALNRLYELWPRSAPVDTLLQGDLQHMEDLLLLHNNGLVELRLESAPNEPERARLNQLNQLEVAWGGYYTTPNHQRVERLQYAPTPEPA